MPVSSPKDNLSRDSPTPTRKYAFFTILTIFVNSSEIQENKEQTIEAMRNVHNTLNAFQEEFQQRLNDLGNDLKRQLHEEGEIFRDTWTHNH